MQVRLVAALVAVVAVAVACDQGPPNEGPSTPVPTFVGSGGCANERLIAADETAVRPPVLTGDVDGDGDANDRVTVRVDASAPSRCVAFLVVATRPTTYASRLRLIDGGDIRQLMDLGLPSATSLAEINGSAGAEIVVRTHAGASTEFFAVFTLAGGSLQQLRAPNNPDGLFGSGGSVTHLEAVDCGDRGELVVVSAVSQGDEYVVTTQRFVAGDGAFRREDVERRSIPSAALADMEEFAAPPFARCPVS